MTEEARKRNAIMTAIQNHETRIADLESKDGGWAGWARQLIIALIAALLGILGYTELVL